MLPNDIHRILYLYSMNNPNYLLYVSKNKIILYHEIKINWFILCCENPLSIEFVDHFFYKIKWNIISRYYLLDTKILYRYYDKLNWKYICMYQNLSNSFIQENIDLMDFNSLLLNKNYPEGHIKNIINKRIGEEKLFKILNSKKRYKKILYKFLN